MPSMSDLSEMNSGGAYPVDVGLLPDPYAHQLAYFTQMSRFDLAPTPQSANLIKLGHSLFGGALPDAVVNALGEVDPRTYLLQPPSQLKDWSDFGFDLVLLNSVTRPLKLVETLTAARPANVPGNPDSGSDIVLCYPSGSLDGSKLDHVIPATRPYPIRANHVQELVAGVGFYRFMYIDGATRDPDFFKSSRALSFSLNDSNAPLVGVHVQVLQVAGGKASTAHVAVTADVEKDYGDLETFRQRTLKSHDMSSYRAAYSQSAMGTATYALSAADRSNLTVWGAPYRPLSGGRSPHLIVVWVRDISSTVG